MCDGNEAQRFSLVACSGRRRLVPCTSLCDDDLCTFDDFLSCDGTSVASLSESDVSAISSSLFCVGRDRRPYFLVPTMSFGEISRSDSKSLEGFVGDAWAVVDADVSVREDKQTEKFVSIYFTD